MNNKFSLGETYITKGAMNAISAADVQFALARHLSGDWGELPDVDKQLNDEAVRSGQDRIFSAYKSGDGIKFYIITEWDRSSTTILLPEEY